MSEVVEGNAPPLLGRKVFFVNPSFKVQTQVVTMLRENEYEVYIIHKWRDVKNFMIRNPDSVCFIGVDGQLSLQAWKAMVESFADSKIEALRTIICGFLTENPMKDPKKQPNFTCLKAGFNSTAGDVEHVAKVLSEILRVKGAKGRRQYVRCSCFKENAFMYLTLADAGGNPSMFQMKVVDISTATVAVEVPDIFKGRLKPRQWLHNTVVVLNGRQVETALHIFLVKKTDRGTEIAILAFHEKMPSESKTYIRNFIFTTLQKQMDMCINGMVEDQTDYNLAAASSNLVLSDDGMSGKKNKKKGASQNESDESSGDKSSDDNKGADKPSDSDDKSADAEQKDSSENAVTGDSKPEGDEKK